MLPIMKTYLNTISRRELLAATGAALLGNVASAREDNRWETTQAGVTAVQRGLQWLARSQGVAGNWGSNDLGLVSLGALAFLAAGHAPERSKQYGDNVSRALNFVLSSAKPSGLLNISDPRRDMYNHGLSAFVLTQAYGVHHDRRMGPALDKALKLISRVQCSDGGWEYTAVRMSRGHDLSLTVMQAKALRGAMDMGLEVPPEVIARAIAYVRRCFRGAGEGGAGAFTYRGDPIRPGRGAIGVAACGAVCLQEFGEYDDYRIQQSLNLASNRIRSHIGSEKGQLPLEAYAMYYVAQGLYQVGGNHWRQVYPMVRDAMVKTQHGDGFWRDSRVTGQPGQLFATAVGVFALSVPNRYLPILQRGKNQRTSGGTE